MDLPKPLPPLRPQDRLRASRTGSNLSVNALAAVLGVSGSAINDWESGKSTPKLRAALLMEHLFGIASRAWIPDFESARLAAARAFADARLANAEQTSKGPE